MLKSKITRARSFEKRKQIHQSYVEKKDSKNFDVDNIQKHEEEYTIPEVNQIIEEVVEEVVEETPAEITDEVVEEVVEEVDETTEEISEFKENRRNRTR